MCHSLLKVKVQFYWSGSNLGQKCVLWDFKEGAVRNTMMEAGDAMLRFNK